MKIFLGFGWATPVVKRRSAIWCSTLEFMYKVTGRRRFGHRKHMAWERAVGVS